MLRGVLFALEKYICEDDRESEIPSIFHIKPFTGKEANFSLKFYGEARVEGRAGNIKIKPQRLNEADITTFSMAVKKVENYKFGDQFKDLQKLGQIAVIEDEEKIRALAEDLAPAYVAEIIEQANKISSVVAGEKNESGSSSGSPSGKAKKD